MNYLSHFNDEFKLRSCISKSIKKIRKDNKLTQEKLAELLNVSIEHISRIENCKYTCSIMLIFKICTIFKIDIHDFFNINTEISDDNITTFLKNLPTEKYNAITEFCKEIENCRNNS